MEAVRQKFDDETIEKALDTCIEAKFSGDLMPPDAHAVVSYIATVGAREDQFPKTLAEFLVFAEAQALTPTDLY